MSSKSPKTLPDSFETELRQELRFADLAIKRFGNDGRADFRRRWREALDQLLTFYDGRASDNSGAEHP